MAVYKLDFDEFIDDEFELLGIHTTLESYHLAYFINSVFNVQLKRTEVLLEFDFYEFNDHKNQAVWNLISNRGSQEKDSKKVLQESLFLPEEKEIIYLLPEYKKVDYLVKIEQNTCAIENMIENIKTIPQIITTFAIDTSNLKSKNNLIFY